MPRPFPEHIYVGANFKMKCGSTFVVTKINSSTDIKVKSIESGFETSIATNQITRLNVRDPYAPAVQGVGFVGEGIYTPTEIKANGKSRKTAAYMKWAAMMERCYSDALHKRHPSYADCEVCEEWQDFQVFAEWFYENSPSDEYELDKDLIDRNNRVYSPDKCSFITREQNAAIAKRKLRPISLRKGDQAVTFDSLASAARFIGDNPQNVHRLTTSKGRTVKGWVLA